MGGKVSDRYEYSKVEALFQKQIESDYKVKDVEVGLVGTTLADLDNDGEADDLAGTAILKVGRSFKSFIFLLREDGSMRFLENNGGTFNPKEGRTILSCSNKPIACPDTMERARRQINVASFSVMEYDKKRAGLEVVVNLEGGLKNILNSLEIFAGT